MIRPAMKNLTIIGKHLTGLDIRNSHREKTHLVTEYQKSTMTLIKRYININFKHIDKIFFDTSWYIPKKEINNRYLIALLHEVAHYKQAQKMSLRKWIRESKDFYINDRREDIANRYAKRYYKKFI
jgi:hypothetical protein